MAESGYSPEEIISASEIEKYGYCPLSWWLSRQGVVEQDGGQLEKGTRDHKAVERQLELIHKYEEVSKEAETTVAIFSIVATAIAIASLVMSVFVFDFSLPIIALALLWLLAASMFLYVSLKNTERALATRKMSGFQKGDIVEVGLAGDSDGILVSERYGLRGLPDVILRIDDELVPVELKTGRVPRGPFFSHILQLAAYCLLIEDLKAKAPSYGLLQYGRRIRHEIDYDDELKGILLMKLAEMRSALKVGEVHRNHNRPGKCKNCSRAQDCAERLV